MKILHHESPTYSPTRTQTQTTDPTDNAVAPLLAAPDLGIQLDDNRLGQVTAESIVLEWFCLTSLTYVLDTRT